MNIKELSIRDLKEKIKSNFFTEKELLIFYNHYYSLMIEKNNNSNLRLEYYKVCILILEYLIQVSKTEFNEKIRLDLLNCLYYGYLNFSLLSNKLIISSYFINYYNLNKGLLEKDIISIKELKVITYLKHEYDVFINIVDIDNREMEVSDYAKLTEFNLKQKRVIKDS